MKLYNMNKAPLKTIFFDGDIASGKPMIYTGILLHRVLNTVMIPQPTRNFSKLGFHKLMWIRILIRG